MREDVDFVDAISMFKDDEYLSLETWARSVNHLRLIIIGHEQTPYEGGHFLFEIRMGESYPFQPPYVYEHTLIWHPNIDCSIPPGKLNVCLDLINPDLVIRVDPRTGASGWTPAKSLSNILEALKAMIHMEVPFFNPEDPLNHEAGEQFKRAPEKFWTQAQQWTKKFAIQC